MLFLKISITWPNYSCPGTMMASRCSRRELDRHAIVAAHFFATGTTVFRSRVGRRCNAWAFTRHEPSCPGYIGNEPVDRRTYVDPAAGVVDFRSWDRRVSTLSAAGGGFFSSCATSAARSDRLDAAVERIVLSRTRPASSPISSRRWVKSVIRRAKRIRR